MCAIIALHGLIAPISLLKNRGFRAKKARPDTSGIQEGIAAISTDRSNARAGAAYSWYAIGLLTIIYTLNFLDRQVVNILAESIKDDLKLQDWQIGVLTGLSFALVYAVASIPAARLADHSNRSTLLSGALALWSGFTALCAVASGFWHLALFRLGVGVGESACTPAAHSLIIDLAPRERRATAMAVYQLGAPFGVLLGMVLGGLVADRFGWRAAFLIAGAPGLAIALMALLSLREPRARTPKTMPRAGTFVRDMKSLLGRKAFVLFALGGGLITLRAYGTQAFVASFFFRVHAAGLKELSATLAHSYGIHLGPVGIVGTFLGIVGGIASLIGTMAGGLLADRAARHDPRHYATVAAIPQILQVPFYVAGLLTPDLITSMLLLSVPAAFNSASLGPYWTTIQALATPSTRATAAASALIATTVIGLGFGPLLVGILSDTLAASGMSAGTGLRWSLIAAEMPALLAAALLWMSRPGLAAGLWRHDEEPPLTNKGAERRIA